MFVPSHGPALASVRGDEASTGVPADFQQVPERGPPFYERCTSRQRPDVDERRQLAQTSIPTTANTRIMLASPTGFSRPATKGLDDGVRVGPRGRVRLFGVVSLVLWRRGRGADAWGGQNDAAPGDWPAGG